MPSIRRRGEKQKQLPTACHRANCVRPSQVNEFANWAETIGMPVPNGGRADVGGRKSRCCRQLGLSSKFVRARMGEGCLTRDRQNKLPAPITDVETADKLRFRICTPSKEISEARKI
ncbi:hypothetical protein AVEN_34587-1 [Araneus ventricosus]|uniref:Uncharacterized protein n=1 Tax=Araneus ventricosus TaxID=182803 RepID=A0A4Y2B2W0_ARAVE|nr:hypothetical protein AVEN_34587-1 [Araneus ventricosus]